MTQPGKESPYWTANDLRESKMGSVKITTVEADAVISEIVGCRPT